MLDCLSRATAGDERATERDARLVEVGVDLDCAREFLQAFVGVRAAALDEEDAESEVAFRRARLARGEFAVGGERAFVVARLFERGGEEETRLRVGGPERDRRAEGARRRRRVARAAESAAPGGPRGEAF